MENENSIKNVTNDLLKTCAQAISVQFKIFRLDCKQHKWEKLLAKFSVYNNMIFTILDVWISAYWKPWFIQNISSLYFLQIFLNNFDVFIFLNIRYTQGLCNFNHNIFVWMLFIINNNILCYITTIYTRTLLKNKLYNNIITVQRRFKT